MADVPRWKLDGDWFDVCKCDIPCPCEFARTPTYGDCDGILAWHVRKGAYGEVPLDGLNVVALGYFKGNIWEGAKATMAIFIDARADARQREALTGPTTLPGQRVQTLNPPGSEVGPNAVATWGTAKVDRADACGFKWSRSGQSSKHIAFSWSGPA